MKRLVNLFLLSMFSLFLPLQSFAWNALGHMVIADIAYGQLKPAVRQKVDNLIAKFNQEYPNIKTFQQAAYWPDGPLYDQKIQLYARWHYIDVAFSEDGTPLKNLIDTDNVVWALKQLSPVVKNEQANAYERARLLTFMVHFVGDIHQPLHTVSRISANYPDGDKGGNSFPIQYQIRGTKMNNLHKLWDSGIGQFDTDLSEEHVTEISQRITTLYPENYFQSRTHDLNFDNWKDEGVHLAKTVVYNTKAGQPPTMDYIENSKKITEQQTALAGYRLAALLNQLLG